MKPKTGQVFVDTGLFKALVDKEDQYHQKSIGVMANLYEKRFQLLTSNFVLDETFTLVRVKCGLSVLKRFRDSLSASFQALKIIRITLDDEAGAWEWFLRDWEKLSYTDCTSFAVMKRLGLIQAASFDKHFEWAGFTLV